jgi:putative NADPH-quinone reductase
MNVLVLNGSPKGEQSNTLRLTRAFLDGAGWQNAEYIDVAKAGIQGCLGCFACWNQTPGRCVLSDGMAAILPKLIAADVVIWSFPLYYYSVPGCLKHLIDRQLPMNLPFMAAESESGGHPPRYDTSAQRHAVLSTCGFWTARGNYDAVTFLFDHFRGPGRYAALFCGQGELFRVPELKARTDAYLETVRQAGAEFAGGGVRAETLATLSEPLYPREAFEKMADASWGTAESGVAPGDAQADESLRFTQQMAALYSPDGAERILEIFYTDLGKTYQLLLGADGAEVVTEGFRPCTTKIETPYPVWRSISRGEISGQDALFRRLYTVSGDFSLMLKWDEVFDVRQSAPKPKPPADPKRKPNMTFLLAPWIVIWMALAIHPTVGGALGVLAAAVLPLCWLAFRPVRFEQISVPLVAGLSLAALLGADTRLLVPLSYLLFGAMWLIGSFPKIPLTAHYSAAGYGDERAFSNPLFLRTNRILTAVWGVLYLVTSVYTYFLMGTGLSAYVGLINSVCPALMGIFTLWFQKWYPARWARG